MGARQQTNAHKSCHTCIYMYAYIGDVMCVLLHADKFIKTYLQQTLYCISNITACGVVSSSVWRFVYLCNNSKAAFVRTQPQRLIHLFNQAYVGSITCSDVAAMWQLLATTHWRITHNVHHKHFYCILTVLCLVFFLPLLLLLLLLFPL